MSLSPDQLVQLIHDSPGRVVLAATGGGSRAIAELLEVPGGSKTLIEAVVPYSVSATIAWLGRPPEVFCSTDTARAMAMVAFQRAYSYESRGGVSGVACTASLASDRPKRGPHRIHVALQTAARTAVWHLQLLKQRRSRVEEERLAGHLTLNAIADACGVAERLELELLEGETIEQSAVDAPAEWQNLFFGRASSVRVGPDIGQPELVFPGAFNPLHAGHRRMFEIATEELGQPGAFELSIVNVDKPPLDYMEIARRLEQFSPERTVYLTRSSRFTEKAQLFAGAMFIVGTDTICRIASPQYHNGDTAALRRSLRQLSASGCRFLVFCRAEAGAEPLRLDELRLPEVLRSICDEVPPEVFRDDVSSTELRRTGAE